MTKWVPYEKTPEGIRRVKERFTEAMLLIVKAAAENNGALFLEALTIMPADKIDERMELRREWIQSRIDRNDTPGFGPPEIIVPPVDESKPVYRKDGQVHNFDALPYPGQKPYTLKQYQVRTGGQDRGSKPGK